MVCPSRGRPGNIAELARCWEATGTEARLLVVVDDDDPEFLAYAHFRNMLPADSLVEVRSVREPRRLGPILNAVMPGVAATCKAVGFLGDDHRPRTSGWDQALVNALPGVAYGNDLFQGEKIPTAVVMSSGIVTTLGYFAPPGAMHLYFDDFWKTIGQELGALTYLPDVIIEHVHPAAGKAAWDEGYARVNSITQYSSDGDAYQRFLAGQWIVDRERLKAWWASDDPVRRA